MSAQPFPRLTVEQYLGLERAAPNKHEYYDGRMYAMAGGSFAHARLISNLTRYISEALDDSPCVVATTELLVRTSSEGLHTYPDIVVVCGEASLADEHRDILLNPTVLIEVLSKSTEAHDRGLKFKECRRIESLQEYVLVSQIEPRVEVFRRGSAGEWTLRDFSGTDALCQLASLNCEIPLARIYRNVRFAEP